MQNWEEDVAARGASDVEEGEDGRQFSQIECASHKQIARLLYDASIFHIGVAAPPDFSVRRAW